MAFTDLLRNGIRRLSQPPIDDIEEYWTPTEKAQVSQMLSRSIVGAPATISAGIAALVEKPAPTS